MPKRVAIIGGGVAGMEASACLAKLGMRTILIERQNSLGGHLQQWDHLFPNRRPASEVLQALAGNLNDTEIMLEAIPEKIDHTGSGYIIHLDKGKSVTVEAILLATGFDLFEARKKEEYGYGIYDNVITAAELEERFSAGEGILTRQDHPVKRVGFVHCVGSRDVKTGNLFCSKVCCITAVKQAIGIRQKNPETEVFCFYMDLRMYGLGFEELYKEAQEVYSIQFIRGRLSEAFENMDGSVMIKVEDTLTGRPLRMNVGLLVLMAGMTVSEGTKRMAALMGLELDPHNYLTPSDIHLNQNATPQPGVFITGTCTGPKSIEDTIADARSAALAIFDYLKPES